MRRSAGLAASLFLTVLSLAGCGKGGVIGSGPLPTPSPIVPSVTNEFAVPTANSKPGGITLGADAFLYFTEQAGGNIGRVTTGGSLNEYSIATSGGTAGNNAIDITTGPDVNLWFTEQGAKPGLATMTLSNHAVTEFPIAGSSPTYIISGPVRNTLVFSDPGHNAIGTYDITTATVTETAIPTANANPMGLAIGTDQKVYIAEHDASKIGVFDPVANTIVEVPTLTAGAGPTSVVLGADRNIWFTENSAVKMGSITTTGRVNEFPLAPATSATALVLGRDNNLYFVDALQNKIGSISGVAPGTVTEYNIPTASAFPVPAPGVFPGKMVLGPDGRIYTAEVNGNKIAQINY